MKNELYKHLKFRMGEESYLNEFKLITKDEYCCKKYCYDVYEFEKEKDEQLCDLKIEKIQLYYNADILTKIDYYFKHNLYTKLKVWINQFLGNPYQEKVIDNVVYCSWYFGKYYLILRKFEIDKMIILSYQKRKNL